VIKHSKRGELAASYVFDGGYVTASLSEPISLNAGDFLEVLIS
jgi:hypothetical protein